MKTGGRCEKSPVVALDLVSRPNGRERIRNIVMEFYEEKKKIKASDQTFDTDIGMSKTEICDQIERTRKGTKYLIALLPELDPADLKRLARAAKPVPVVRED